MPIKPTEAKGLERMYRFRFDHLAAYRSRTWRVLVDDFFRRFIEPEAAVLDLGCGYGEFINRVPCGTRYAMDLNPAAVGRLASGVMFLEQDCSEPWAVEPESLDVVFTSNFLEHLSSKRLVDAVLSQALAALKPGGRFIALGPNIRCLPGKYWDFWDHHVPLSDRSIIEALRNQGFEIERAWARFLPYTMARSGLQYPVFLLRIYLRIRLAWRIFGKQFLVIARKPARPDPTTARA